MTSVARKMDVGALQADYQGTFTNNVVYLFVGAVQPTDEAAGGGDWMDGSMTEDEWWAWRRRTNARRIK